MIKKLIWRFDFGDGKIEGPVTYPGYVDMNGEFVTTEGTVVGVMGVNLNKLPDWDVFPIITIIDLQSKMMT